MSIHRLAIIGTAGRKEDQGILTSGHYERMLEGTCKLIHHLQIDPQNLHLFSGGAAWADHLVVSLVIRGLVPAKNLTLYLPAKLEYYGFEGGDGYDQKVADTANYYHKMFKMKSGIDGLVEIRTVGNMGATLEPISGGFFARNSLVANSPLVEGHLLAYTFGDPNSSQDHWTIRRFESDIRAKDAGLKDGGTADTWNKARCSKWHARIGVINDKDIYI